MTIQRQVKKNSKFRKFLLLINFNDYFEHAREISKAVSGLVVTDESQTEEMARARTARLTIKNIRLEVEATRKQLKEQSLREGKAIDGMANIIKALIVPIEEHLEKQERFAETKAAERLQTRNAQRIEKLSKYVDDVSIYSLKDMPDVVFDKLVENSKLAWEQKKEKEAKLEADRIARERAAEVEQARIKKENEQLKKEAEEREAENQKKLKAQREKLAIAEKARKDAEKKLADEKAAQLAKEQAAKQAEEAKNRAEAQTRAKVQAEAEEAQRKALLAPDKEKLLDFAKYLQVLKAPAMQSNEGNTILNEALDQIAKAVGVLQEGVKTL